MIDPKALQQHFKNVSQRQTLPEIIVPRVSYSKTLTSIEPIPVYTEPVQTQENFEVLEADITESFTPTTSTIDIKQLEIEEEYNPYEYYSGPKF